MGEKNGLRRDLVQALYDLRPGVFRFPGGCIVEGADIETRYQWKNTVGAVENRPLKENRWEYTFNYRFAPDYFQSGGLGFYEYFLLAEQLGAEDDVTSPTFAIVNEYVGQRVIYHFDMYRIERWEEALDFGSEEYLSSGELCLVEWPEKIEPLLPDDAMTVRITVGEDEHRIFEIE